MKKIYTALLSVILSGCAGVDFIPTGYIGPDSGIVILGIGASTGTRGRGLWYATYSFYFRKRIPLGQVEKKSLGIFQFCQSDHFFCQREPDYQSAGETGVILVNTLPPGEYEIYNFDYFFTNGWVQKTTWSGMDFSIPFSVKSGQVTYLGNYEAQRITTKNFTRTKLPSEGVIFKVTDRVKSDMEIAETLKNDKLDVSENATPTPRTLINPFFLFNN